MELEILLTSDIKDIFTTQGKPVTQWLAVPVLGPRNKLIVCYQAKKEMPTWAGCGPICLPENPLEFSSISCWKALSSSSKIFFIAASKSFPAPNSSLL